MGGLQHTAPHCSSGVQSIVTGVTDVTGLQSSAAAQPRLSHWLDRSGLRCPLHQWEARPGLGPPHCPLHSSNYQANKALHCCSAAEFSQSGLQAAAPMAPRSEVAKLRIKYFVQWRNSWSSELQHEAKRKNNQGKQKNF